MSMIENSLPPNKTVTIEKLSLRDLGQALGFGFHTFRKVPLVSLAYAFIPTLLGLILLWFLNEQGFSLLFLVAAVGFTLMTPALITGYFKVCTNLENLAPVRIGTPYKGFISAPGGVWVIALICSFLFLIWITDAGILYSFMIGQKPLDISGLELTSSSVLSFWFWGSFMGSVLGLIIYSLSAFSVPLLQESRQALIQAIITSIKTVFASLIPNLVWAAIISVFMMIGILFIPLLPIFLPILSYAGFKLYRQALPDTQHNHA